MDTGKAYDTPEFALGFAVDTDDGSEYVYVQADTDVPANGFVQIDETHNATALTSSAAVYGSAVGIADTALAEGQYGFVARKGHVPGLVTAGAVADNDLYTSSEAGALTDATEAGTTQLIRGLVPKEAGGGETGPVTMSIAYPSISYAS
ncbi:MAG: hypothetical protein CMN26_07625 [Salinisphaera sp.]|nr:hypothetical protein [Salinisphaera sp.]